MTDTPQTTNPGPEVAILALAEEPAAWAAAGFTVQDRICRIGHVTLHLLGRRDGQAGLVGWALRGMPAGAPGDLDGFPTLGTDQARAEPIEHPNSAVFVDHMVLLTDDLERTVGAAAAFGLTPRRWRDHTLPDGTEGRQAFFRVGQVVLEVVGPRERPEEPRPGAHPFGLAITTLNIEQARSALGEDLGPVRRAVQPGRYIATVRRGAQGLATPLALMSPPPPRPPAPEAGSEEGSEAASAAPEPGEAPAQDPAPTDEPTGAEGGDGPEPAGPFAIPT